MKFSRKSLRILQTLLVSLVLAGSVNFASACLPPGYIDEAGKFHVNQSEGFKWSSIISSPDPCGQNEIIVYVIMALPILALVFIALLLIKLRTKNITKK